jgi:hypothetical protein
MFLASEEEDKPGPKLLANSDRRDHGLAVPEKGIVSDRQMMPLPQHDPC